VHVRRPHAESSRRAQAIYVNDSSRGCRRRVRTIFPAFCKRITRYSSDIFAQIASFSFPPQPASRIFFRSTMTTTTTTRQVNPSVLIVRQGASVSFLGFSFFSALYLSFCFTDEKIRRRISRK